MIRVSYSVEQFFSCTESEKDALEKSFGGFPFELSTLGNSHDLSILNVLDNLYRKNAQQETIFSTLAALLKEHRTFTVTPMMMKMGVDPNDIVYDIDRFTRKWDDPASGG